MASSRGTGRPNPARLALSRRRFLAGAAVFTLVPADLGLRGGPVGPRAALAQESPAPENQTPENPAQEPFRLVAAPGSAPILGPDSLVPDVWAYGAQLPGPELRYRQGGRLRVVLDNQLAVATTVHWHGIRLPNAMDGVPHVTQDPVAPGGGFLYEFDPPDAGTFWYHPHIQSSEQVGRGLYGPLIVEEPEPIRVDREVTWMLDDWRITEDGKLAGAFEDFFDRNHGGRIGNVVTVNAELPKDLAVRAGERIRLRLINVANARYFALSFAGHRPVAIAFDGQPCDPHEPEGGRVVLGPAMRADLVLDMSGTPGSRFAVTDDFYKKETYRLLELVYDNGPPLRESPLDAPLRLPDNPLQQPDLASAVRHKVRLEGGSGGAMSAGTFEGQLLSLAELAEQGKAWALNGQVAKGHRMPPLIEAKMGQSVVLEIINETYFDHPMHIHGHHYKLLTRNGQPVPHSIWHDTVTVGRNERVEVAFVADNRGDWMFHCHILEHQEAGMMGIFRVA